MDETQKWLYENQARLCQMFGNPIRLQLLDLLRDGERTVGELVDGVDTGQSNVSQHLALMRSRGLLATRREGSNIYYRVTERRIYVAYDALRNLLLDYLRAQGDMLAGAAPAQKRAS